MNLLTLIVTTGLFTASCNNGDFAGDAQKKAAQSNCVPSKTKTCSDDQKKKTPPTPSNSGDPNAGDPDKKDDADLNTDDGGIVAITPKSCSTSTISFINNGSGKAVCPAGSAGYAADDVANSAAANLKLLSCCPLPAADILTKDAPADRGNDCQSGEVAVGVHSSGLVCAKINTVRYKLATQVATCYYGSGASGGSGAAKCTIPPETLTAMTPQYGSDMCLPSPFGGLMTKIASKKCADMAAATVLFNDTGLPVPMFK